MKWGVAVCVRPRTARFTKPIEQASKATMSIADGVANSIGHCEVAPSGVEPIRRQPLSVLSSDPLPSCFVP